MRILVTGGAGYIGSHACKALAACGFEPVTYDNLSRGNRWAVKWGPLEVGEIADEERLREVIDRYKPVAAIHFAAFAYVGESVVLRYDPRDVAEVRVFYRDRFLCRAICQELAGATVPLRDIMRARNRHRRDLRQTLRDRAQVVESLLVGYHPDFYVHGPNPTLMTPAAK